MVPANDVDALFNRIRWSVRLLEDVLTGGKPALDTAAPEQAWLFEQFTRMHKAGLFLSEEPKSYFTLPGDRPEDFRYKGSTRREPLHKALTTEEKNLRHFLERYGIHNFQIFGVDHNFRYLRPVLEMKDNAEAFVLTRSDPYGLYQFLNFLAAKLDPAADPSDSVNRKTLVVQNTDGFWTPMLRGLGLGSHQKLLSARGIVMGDTMQQTQEALAALLPSSVTAAKPLVVRHPYAPAPGATILLRTSSGNKVTDYRQIAEAQDTGLSLRLFDALFAKPEDAVEASYSYVGNNIEKLYKLIDLIRDRYGVADFRRTLSNKRIKLANTFLLFDDSGLETVEPFFKQTEFAACHHEMNPYREMGPGAELKGVLSAVNGIRDMFKLCEKAGERILAQRLQAGDTEPKLDLRTYDHCCMMVVSLEALLDVLERAPQADHDDLLNMLPAFFFKAVTEGEIQFTPSPDVPNADARNFRVPVREKMGRTEAEIPNFIEFHGVIAQVFKTFNRAFSLEGRPRDGLSLKSCFNRVATVGTQHTLHRDIQGHGIKGLGRRMNGFRLAGGQNGAFDLAHKRTLGSFFNFCTAMDGFLLTPDNRKIAGDKFLWNRAFMLFSLIVGRQLVDKSVAGKPVVIISSPEQKTWQPLLRLVETLYGRGLIPERPQDLIQVVPDERAAKEALERSFRHYIPDEVPNHPFRDGGEACPDDLYEVTIYCSASTTNAELKAEAREFSFDLAAHGFAIKNGGGTEKTIDSDCRKKPGGLMVETSFGAHLARHNFGDFLKTHGLSAARTHISSIHCHDTAEIEGLCLFNDYFSVEPTIYSRMERLHYQNGQVGRTRKTNAEVVLDGGAGTVQEIAASVLMRLHDGGDYGTRPLIVVNRNGVYDELHKLIPYDHKKMANIHFVETRAQAFNLLKAARRLEGMEPVLPFATDSYEMFKRRFLDRHRALWDNFRIQTPKMNVA